MSRKLLLLAISALFFFSCFYPRSTSPQIDEKDLFKHLKHIASDELEGRRAGTRGAELASNYIANYFKKFGLKPAGDNGTYFQYFDFVSDVKMGDSNFVSFKTNSEEIKLNFKSDFIPLPFSESGKIKSDVIFAGYGITAPEQNYDDYEGIDARGKVVIVLKGTPDGYKAHSPFEKYLSIRYKVSNAQSKGAAGVILVDPFSEKFEKFTYDYSAGKAGIQVIEVKNSVIDKLFKACGYDFKLYDIVKKIYDSQKPNSFPIKNLNAEIQTDVRYIKSKVANVIGYIEGSNHELKNEYIIIGAHYDHLGWGGQGSLIPDTVAIHNGADDNGSGTVGLLELAEYFSHNRKKLNRTLVFIAFTAEEEGTIGSGYYVKNPVFPLENTIAMINMDMIGRMKENKLTIYGVGTSPIWNEIIERLNSEFKFELNLVKDGYGPSDHAQFYSKNIPVLHFFTGIHGDYHKPSDDYDKINYQGQKKILDFIASLTLELDKSKEKPQFVKVETPQRSARGFRVTLGVVPDYSEEVQGMKVSDVRPGTPAEKAGIKPGDVIIKLGEREIKNIYDYTYALGDFNPGDEVEVIILRNGEKLSFKVKFEERK
ncbi:PA domain-containing protein [Candidatus Kryptonium thompsonii]|uniref:PA domain-containing protein n=2 Tax=Candidatus Kryptonium thompsonii TaxID=1633631 RepID=A0A0P1LNU7_9BACT|nr:M20/M25/M40 family metallo-hydrolase [Candidatus Kryptonium thompsoni]CUS83303.1 PA domain-containing protein [Candidatus Kryptonium thompsoni]CUS84195.1 PA domain-containing protein [Candidatus Kryptonium thompsoni]CUS84651.1 PA domain-containing protein [Candidatus Kryptonium thompsoni]CUS87056.1 PA domain-containing protein [Candidatus Kryptonium thompsoni]CUS89055.1 PA domain-containing protein [Candidatus Kryptonium thompsoni]